MKDSPARGGEFRQLFLIALPDCVTTMHARSIELNSKVLARIGEIELGQVASFEDYVVMRGRPRQFGAPESDGETPFERAVEASGLGRAVIE